MSRPRSTILVVEGDPVLRGETAELVESLGYRVNDAGFDDETLSLVVESRFAVLIVDCDGADGAGCELVRRLREREGAGPRTAVIAVTAARDEQARRRCIGAGADEHLVRPVDGEQLSRFLDAWVEAPAILDEDIVGTLRQFKLVAALYTSFVAVLPEQVAALRSAITAGDRAKIRQLAHRLRGSAAQMGAAALAQALQVIEGAAKGLGARPVAMPGEDFSRLIADTIAALRAELEASR